MREAAEPPEATRQWSRMTCEREPARPPVAVDGGAARDGARRGRGRLLRAGLPAPAPARPPRPRLLAARRALRGRARAARAAARLAARRARRPLPALGAHAPARPDRRRGSRADPRSRCAGRCSSSPSPSRPCVPSVAPAGCAGPSPGCCGRGSRWPSGRSPSAPGTSRRPTTTRPGTRPSTTSSTRASSPRASSSGHCSSIRRAPAASRAGAGSRSHWRCSRSGP